MLSVFFFVFFFNEVGGRGDKLYSNLFTLVSLLGYRLNNDLVKYFLDKTRLVSLYPDLFFFFLPPPLLPSSPRLHPHFPLPFFLSILVA